MSSDDIASKRQDIDEVKRNVVQIFDANYHGTGFFIRKGYCVTCHDVVCRMERICVKHQDKTYVAEWIIESPTTKNIAFLKIINSTTIPLVCAQEITPNLHVSVCRAEKNMCSLRGIQGIEVNGIIGPVPTQLNWLKENMNGSNAWNIKPASQIGGYHIECEKLDDGMSGSPVWEPHRGRIVGMLAIINGTDTSQKRGCIIPIETILRQERRLEKSFVITDQETEYYDGLTRFKTGLMYMFNGRNLVNAENSETRDRPNQSSDPETGDR